MRKQRVRRSVVAVISMIGAMALLLTACGADREGSGGDADGDAGNGSESGGVTTLTFAASTFGQTIAMHPFTPHPMRLFHDAVFDIRPSDERSFFNLGDGT
ncbi:hypothetical protein G1H11_11390 [Phytoactinopolyspora alkaliphila]|uniref:ABC transporter substrate-binding protein n=1 Tax=Phytoactinopolyspora alkaliphila TaxID=1783498 RepID=A0A6N9YLT0_9ACTN|nr:hypothetical protein [Phytoactinopolyspora alkaliphila]NED95912.1 hypothetical protein [Phytoactinopolyspora alkaliphila]